MSETQNEDRTPAAPGSLIGHVKWFNNNDGYGFITIVSEGDNKNSDIFTHQSNIYPRTSGYRTLRPGEYVSLNLSEDERPQATDVTGVYGGPLMCDTQILLRNAARSNAPDSNDAQSSGGDGYNNDSQQSRGGRGRGGRGRGRGRGGRPNRGPRQGDSTPSQGASNGAEGGEGWTTVQ